MNIFDLKKAIRAKTVEPFYVFYGLERVGMQVYWEHLAQCSHRELCFVDTVHEVYTRRKSFLDGDILYVCYADKAYLSAGEDVWERLSSVLGRDALVLTYDSIDKRGKFYKYFESHCVEFSYFTKEVLAHHIQKAIPLSDKMCYSLISACGSSYGRILLEVDKAKRIMQALPEWTADEVVDEMLYRGVIYSEAGDTLFALVNAIISKDTLRAYACAHEGDIAPLPLIVTLYNAFKRLLSVQYCKEELSCTDKAISKETGLKETEVYAISRNTGVRNTKDILTCMQVLRKAEKGIKEGVLCEEHAINYLLITLL